MTKLVLPAPPEVTVAYTSIAISAEDKRCRLITARIVLAFLIAEAMIFLVIFEIVT